MSGSTDQLIVYFKFLITMNFQDAVFIEQRQIRSSDTFYCEGFHRKWCVSPWLAWCRFAVDCAGQLMLLRG